MLEKYDDCFYDEKDTIIDSIEIFSKIYQFTNIELLKIIKKRIG